MKHRKVIDFSDTVTQAMLKEMEEIISAAKDRYSEGDCWPWDRHRDKKGYGVIIKQINYSRMLRRAHRIAYIVAMGNIPTDLDVDHLCRNKSCFNPDHLEAVSALENQRRGLGNAGKVLCKRGHDDWFHNRSDKPHQRKCKTCELLLAKRTRYRLKGLFLDIDNIQSE